MILDDKMADNRTSPGSKATLEEFIGVADQLAFPRKRAGIRGLGSVPFNSSFSRLDTPRCDRVFAITRNGLKRVARPGQSLLMLTKMV